MQVKIKQLKRLIKETLKEIGSPKGSLRRVRGDGGRQVKIGKVAPDENRQLTTFEAEELFPGSTDAWAEVLPDMFPDYVFADDPVAIKKHSLWFMIGPKLMVSMDEMPQLELAFWNPEIEDWMPTEHLGEGAVETGRSMMVLGAEDETDENFRGGSPFGGIFTLEPESDDQSLDEEEDDDTCSCGEY